MLVNVAGDHDDLQVLPIVRQTDVLALDGRLGQ